MNRIGATVNGKRAIAIDSAMRLAWYSGTSPQHWLTLQNACDPGDPAADREAGVAAKRRVTIVPE